MFLQLNPLFLQTAARDSWYCLSRSQETLLEPDSTGWTENSDLHVQHGVRGRGRWYMLMKGGQEVPGERRVPRSGEGEVVDQGWPAGLQ